MHASAQPDSNPDAETRCGGGEQLENGIPIPDSGDPGWGCYTWAGTAPACQSAAFPTTILQLFRRGVPLDTAKKRTMGSAFLVSSRACSLSYLSLASPGPGFSAILLLTKLLQRL
jgi:hypothetical protein